MAIYHLQAKVIQRSAGRSVIAAAAYRAATALYDAETGRTENYLAKPGVVHSEILLPAGAPADWQDRELLWNTVVAGEQRRDAVLAREIELALPRELSQAEAIALVRDYVAEQFVARGMVADLNVHWGYSADGEAQPHAHVLLTMRRVADGSFGLKERGWNDKALLREWRQRWAELANERLALAGHDERVDHRSHAERGLDLEPQHKIGPAGARRAARGEDAERAAEHRAIAWRNGERIAADPRLALDALTQQQSTFTRADLARLVHRHSDGAAQFARVLARVEGSPELVHLGTDGRGQARFSTREMIAIEQRLIATATTLAGRMTHSVNDKRRRGPVKRKTLSGEQFAAYMHVTRSRDLAVLIGIAGGGKSTMLGTARAIWEAEGFRVRGAALAGIAAEGLEGSAGIASRTIASWEYAWAAGQELLTKRDVLVLDEAGMVGSRQLGRVLEAVSRAGAKLVLVGDAEQLQSIEAGAAFRAIADRVGAIAITEPRRQVEVWQRTATKHLATARTGQAIAAYGEAGLVTRHATREAARAGVIAGWAAARQAAPEATHLILAHERADVRALNDAARSVRHRAGELGAAQALPTATGERGFAVGDRLYFLRNERGLGVRNGSLGTLEAIEGTGENARLAVRLDGPAGEGRVVRFALSEYDAIDHGYAATIHRNQGATVDQAHVLATPGMDRHLTYVALTRHRLAARLHWGADEFGGPDGLSGRLGRERAKDTTLDYGEATPEWAYAERRGLHPLAPASEIVVGAPVPGPLAADTAALHAGVTALETAGQRLRDLMALDLAEVRRQARERLDGGRLRQALRAALHDVARTLRQGSAWLQGAALPHAEAAAADATPTRLPTAPPTAPPSRFAGLRRRLEGAPPASVPVPSVVRPEVPALAAEVVQGRQQLRDLALAWADAERMRAAGLPVLAHQATALRSARQAYPDQVADHLVRVMATRPDLVARIDEPDGPQTLARAIADTVRAEQARAEAERARAAQAAAAAAAARPSAESKPDETPTWRPSSGPSF